MGFGKVLYHFVAVMDTSLDTSKISIFVKSQSRGDQQKNFRSSGGSLFYQH